MYNIVQSHFKQKHILPSRNLSDGHENSAAFIACDIQQVPGSNASDMQRKWSCKETCRDMQASFAQSFLLWLHSKDIIAFWSLRIIKLQTCRYSFKQRKSLQSVIDFFPRWVKIEVARRPGRPKHAQARQQSQPSATSATPATRNEGGCQQVPDLPCETKVDVTN